MEDTLKTWLLEKNTKPKAETSSSYTMYIFGAIILFTIIALMIMVMYSRSEPKTQPVQTTPIISSMKKSDNIVRTSFT